MKRVVVSLMGAVLAAACAELTGSFDEVIAIEVFGASTQRVEEGDTLVLRARALDAHGDSVAADIVWTSLEPDTAPVGFTLDEATGTIAGLVPGGPWSIQGSVGTLRTSTIRLVVAGAPDSIASVGATDVIATGTGASPALTVKVFDLTTSPGNAPGLSGVPVTFRAVGGGGNLLVRQANAADSTATPDSATIVTIAGGTASAAVLLVGAPADSALIDAVITTARGQPVVGSPVRFVIRFQ